MGLPDIRLSLFRKGPGGFRTQSKPSVASSPVDEHLASELILVASDEDSKEPTNETLSVSTTPAEAAQEPPAAVIPDGPKGVEEANTHSSPTQVVQDISTEQTTSGPKEPKESVSPSKVGVKKVVSKPQVQPKRTPAPGAAKAPVRAKSGVATASSIAKRVPAARNNVALRKSVSSNSTAEASVSKPTVVPTRKPAVPASTNVNLRQKHTIINARPAIGSNQPSKATTGVSATRATSSKSPLVKEVRLSLNGIRRTDATAKPAPRKLKTDGASTKPVATAARKESELEKKNLELQELSETQLKRIANLESTIKSAEEKIHWLETQLAQVDTLNHQQAEAESGYEETIRGLRTELESERCKQQETAALVESQLAEISSQLELVKGKATESERLRDVHQNKLLEQTQKVHELESQLQALNKQHEARIGEREEKLALAEAALATSRNELENTRAMASEAQKALEQSKVNSQAEELGSLKLELVKAKEAESRSKNELEALKASKSQEIKNLTLEFEKKLTKASVEAKQREEESRQLMSTVEELKRGFDLAQNEIQEKDKLVEEKKKSLATTEETMAQHSKLLGEHQDLKLKFAESKGAVAKLQVAQEQLKKLQREKEEIICQQDFFTKNQHALAKITHEKEQLAEHLLHMSQELERLKQEQETQALTEKQLRQALAAFEIKQVEAAALESEFKKLQDELKASKALQEELARKNISLLQNIADHDEVGIRH
ncbi:hypothetical protein L0F63_006334 [Massospora cicadina]|nr:hypothetical protein L0F63_006334 [Massospora cicadina]